QHRLLTASEFRQLTGRAGRRGIDEVGYAVVLHQKFVSLEQARALARAEPEPVLSSFKVTYNMAVNLLSERTVNEAKKILDLSFAQYVADKNVVNLEAKISFLSRELELERKNSSCASGGDAKIMRGLERKLSRLEKKLASISRERKAKAILETLQSLKPGDVVLTEAGKPLAVVKSGMRAGDPSVLVVNSLGRYRRISKRTTILPFAIGKVDINKITSPKKKVRRSVSLELENLSMSVESAALKQEKSDEEKYLGEEIKGVKNEMETNLCRGCIHSERCMESARRFEKLDKRIEGAKREKESGFEVISGKLENIVLVLEEFGFMKGAKPTLKGMTLKKIYNECDLLVAEAIHSGILKKLRPEEIAAFASWFIYDSGEPGVQGERLWEDATHLEGVLLDAFKFMISFEKEIKRAEMKMKIDTLGSIDLGASELTGAWACGLELEDILERFPGRPIGDIVRTMRQVIDLLRQICSVVTDSETLDLVREAIHLVDRGIVGYSSFESIIEHGVEV
ncbi:MAG: hypothetical protein PHP64_03070, partial [Actinomycetota bacterium]|nr:hypothetical protein [Actinomycetota bacterium]